MSKLTVKQIDAANREKDGAKLFDGKGLFLSLNKSGGKYWQYKYRHLGKEKLMSLGVYPEISLAEAREKHRIAHKLVSEGHDPMQLQKDAVDEKKQDQANTFEKIAREWLEYKKTEWSETNYKTVKQRLEKDVFPVIGIIPIKSLTHGSLIDLAKTIQERGANELAKRVIQMAKHIFQYAIIHEYAETNITEDLKGFIKTPQTKSYAAIDPKDLPKFLKDFEKHKSRMHRQSQIALELMMLTFVRTSELIKAEWGEFDLDHKIWAIPAKRMKMNNDHLVPLSDQAIALINELRELHRNNHWVFPSRTRSMNHMSNNTILMALDRMGYRGIMTGHGFRSLAMTTIMERLGYAYDMVYNRHIQFQDVPTAPIKQKKSKLYKKALDPFMSELTEKEEAFFRKNQIDPAGWVRCQSDVNIVYWLYKKLTDDEFEAFCCALMAHDGAMNVRISQKNDRGHDGGIDGYGRLDGKRFAIQAKRYSPKREVWRNTCQAFVGALSGEALRYGYIITTASLSDKSQQYLDRIDDNVKVPVHIDVIDQSNMVDVMSQIRPGFAHGLGVWKTRKGFLYMNEDLIWQSIQSYLD